jgi:hypothetical protein
LSPQFGFVISAKLQNKAREELLQMRKRQDEREKRRKAQQEARRAARKEKENANKKRRRTGGVSGEGCDKEDSEEEGMLKVEIVSVGRLQTLQREGYG